MSQPRLAPLDAIRGLSAALVVVYHVRLILGIDLLPDQLAAGGSAGVSIFFVLSGYLLFRPFLSGAVDLRHYAIRRILRIWPAYLLALVGCSLLIGATAPAQDPLLFATLAQNYDPNHDFQVVGVSWTLTIEVAFYATVPLLAWFVLRRPAQRRIPTLLWLGTASLIGHFLAIAFTVAHPGFAWGLVIVDAYPLMLWAFIPGMILAVLDERGIRLAPPWVLALGVAFLALGVVTHPQRLDVATAVGTMLVLGWSLTRDVPTTLARIAGVLGALSFGLYLWHYDVLLWTAGLGLDAPTAAMVGVSLAVACAVGSYLFIERPAIQLGRSLTAPRRSRRQAIEAAALEERAITAAAPSS